MNGWAIAVASMVAVAFVSIGHAADRAAAFALVNVTKSSDGIQILAQAMALTDTTVSGEMTINRKGSAGTVSTRQGRKLTLSAGQTKDIARVGVSYKPGDELEVTVVLRDGDKVISRSSLSTP